MPLCSMHKLYSAYKSSYYQQSTHNNGLQPWKIRNAIDPSKLAYVCGYGLYEIALFSDKLDLFRSLVQIEVDKLKM